MKGFTLIELLVALAISSLLAVMAYGGLSTILETREQTDYSAKRLQQIQKAFLWLKRDSEQTVLRTIRDEYGDYQRAFLAAEHGRYRLELTRGGYRNPARLPRSTLQRVAYSLEENNLQRLSWPYLDRAQDAEPVKVRLLEDVNSLSFRFLDADREWHASWPPVNSEQKAIPELPLAIEVSLELEDWGRLTRLFVMAGQ
ncbi:MAG: type II secretion system minor pseudopilin GspJ [Gammaproteobacteria bacterium]|jgi:general secretion pathway protein J